ncbi:MAG: helix-turn-helix domain-containing protein [Thermomicrobiales bacterium]
MAGSSIWSMRFDSASSGDAFPEQWRNAVSTTQVVSWSDADPLSVDVRFWRIGPMLLSIGTFSPQRFARTADVIRRTPYDNIGLVAIERGTAISIIDGIETVIQPGEVQTFDFGQPRIFDTHGTAFTTLDLPREPLERLIPGLRRVHGRILQPARAALLGRHLSSLGRILPLLDDDDLDTLANVTVQFAIETLCAELNDDSPLNRLELRERATIAAWIRHAVDGPMVTPQGIAETFAVSRSHLYHLFSRDGGVERFIRGERLRVIRDVLKETAGQRTLDEIAEAYGFSSGFALSRSFFDHFGYRPRDVITVARASRGDASAREQELWATIHQGDRGIGSS